jgi:PAS domain S-box-containing protein
MLFFSLDTSVSFLKCPSNWGTTFITLKLFQIMKEIMDIHKANKHEDLKRISFEDLFDLDDIQQLQDEFAEATGVASIITHTDGTPITSPSNFCQLCRDLIRKSNKGLQNCFKSDAEVGRYNPDGPNVQRCLSGGLWDAGAGITVGGQHIANWLIGQVRDETQTDENMIEYAKEIGVDAHIFIEAFREVPSMSREQFNKIAQMLFTLANQLSTRAYQNVLQERVIAGRKQAEEALKESEQKYRELVQYANSIILRWGPDGKLKFLNDFALQFFGYSESEIIGKNVIGKIIPENESTGRDLVFMINDITENPEKYKSNENENICSDGKRVWISWTNKPIKDKNGQLVEILSVGNDITERKRMEEVLQQSQKIEAIGTLAGGIAHDFNNILGGIIGYTELSLECTAQNSPVQNYLDEILKSSTRAKNLIKQILTFSRKSQEERKPILMSAIVEEVTKLLRSTIPTTIEMRQDLHDAAIMVNADPTQMHQIVMNLCTNATHAMQETGGVLEIDLSPVVLSQRDAVRYHGLKPGPYIKLKISDTGTGIDVKNLPRIFEPFFTTKEKEKGTGMGLAVVHGIVKDYDGDLFVETQSGKGTVFTILLPQTIAELDTVENVSANAQPESGSESILLVDDEIMLMEIGKMILESLGYTVTAKNSSIEALETFQQTPDKFDMVITDQTMPHMTGYDLAKRILEIKPTVPVILCTGYSNTVTPEKAEAEGIKALIYKPVSKNELAATVREVLDK